MVMHMTTWLRHPHFGRIAQLKNEGRELIGKDIYWTEKRDGSNISFWIDDDGNFRVSSHNMQDAEAALISKVTATAEYEKLFELVGSEPNKIFYAELIQIGRGPTRIEPPHKIPRLVLFDCLDTMTGKFLMHNFLHQLAYHHKIPVVKLFGVSRHDTMQSLFNKRDEMLEYCKKHRREGVVGKVYNVSDTYGIYFKEKIDLPRLQKEPRTNTQPRLPSMPPDLIQSAMEQAKAEVERNGHRFNDPKHAMPIVVAHLTTQAREHDYATPKGMFTIYQQFLEGVTQ